MARNFSTTAVATTLTSDITNVATSMNVASTSGFPSVPFTLVIEPGTSNAEAVNVTNVASLTLTIARGYSGTTGVAHLSGSVVKHMAVGEDFQDVHDVLATEANVLELTGVSSEPAVPAAGDLKIYSKSVGGRMMPKMVGPSGVDAMLQPFLGTSRFVLFQPQTGTTGTGGALGPVWTSNGTVSHPTPASTAPAITNQMKRTRYANVATTTNQQLGPRYNAASEQMFWRGNAAGLGGFYFYTRFSVELYPASTVRIFAGLSSTNTGSVVISDTVLNNTCGLWHDTTDSSTTFNFVTRDAATTTKQAIALSNAIAAGNLYDFTMFCPPNGTTITWRLVDLVNNVTYSNSTSTTLPANTAFMQPQVQMSNGTANVTVTTVAIGVASIYVESDY